MTFLWKKHVCAVDRESCTPPKKWIIKGGGLWSCLCAVVVIVQLYCERSEALVECSRSLLFIFLDITFFISLPKI